MQKIYTIKTPAAMQKFGASLAKKIESGSVVYLCGELGAGKTTFVRGFLRALGHKGIVKSPTFTLLEPYQIDDKKIYHFDLYRLNDAEELEFIGARDCFDMHAICLIEWPERGMGFLPQADLILQFDFAKHGRTVTLCTKVL